MTKPFDEQYVKDRDAAAALETGMDSKRVEFIFKLLELKLQKYRICNRIGLKYEDEFL
jgi:hypothetical protein